MNLSEKLPTLSKGDPEEGSGKISAGQAVAYLAGEEWTHTPKCVQPVLNSLTTAMNYLLPNDQMHRMWPSLLRQIRTARPGMEPVLSIRLTAFLAQRVLYLVREDQKDICRTAIEAALQWCDCPCADHAEAALYVCQDIFQRVAECVCAGEESLVDELASESASKAALSAADAACLPSLFAELPVELDDLMILFSDDSGPTDAMAYAAAYAYFKADEAAYADYAAKVEIAYAAAYAAAYSTFEADRADWVARVEKVGGRSDPPYFATAEAWAQYAGSSNADIKDYWTIIAAGAAGAANDLVALFEAAQAEYERLTGHIPQEIDSDRWNALCEMTLTGIDNS